jgi:hypothetical protein
LPALNARVTERHFGGSEISLDRFVGLYPEQAARLCLVLFVPSAELTAHSSSARALYGRYKGHGLALLLVAVDGDPGPRALRSAERMPYPVLHDAFGVAAAAWGVNRTPAFFFVEADGRVRLEGRFDLDAPKGFAKAALDHMLRGREH